MHLKKTFKNRLENLKNNFTAAHAVIIGLSAMVAVSSVAVYQYKRAEKYQLRLENQYMRAMSDLLSFVKNIESNLTRAIVATDTEEMIKIANDVYSQSSFARSTLGQLPCYNGALSGTSEFLAQVGDWTHSLSLRCLDGESISNKEYDTLEGFISHAASLEGSLSSLQDELYSGRVLLSDLQDRGAEAFEKENARFASAIKDTENNFEDFPSLIYDGPFSDHLKDHKPALLEGTDNITKEAAEAEVKRLVGKKFTGEISYLGENAGPLPTYNFSVKQNKKDSRSITVEITKQGGAISWFLDSRSVGGSTLTIDDAMKNAYSFLARYDFGKMKDTYYEIQGGTAVINFAFSKDDVLYYPDLVKVKVALDNGEILGLECSGFISNHKERSLPPFAFSEDEVKSKISPKAEAVKISKCVIPTKSGGEIPCYEVLCKYKDNNFLVYLNCETLKQEDILILLINEKGALTI